MAGQIFGSGIAGIFSDKLSRKSMVIGVLLLSALEPFGAGTALLLASPQPVTGIALIVSGTARDFTFSYSATGAGLIGFSASGYGFDATNAALQAVTEASATLALQNPVSVAGFAASASATVSVGQQFNVLVTVTNTAALPGAPAALVVPQSITLTGAGAATLVSGPVPSAASVTAGSAQTFTYVFQGAVAGALSVSSLVQGVDVNTGVTATAVAASGPGFVV
jgi:hypothetical protein